MKKLTRRERGDQTGIDAAWVNGHLMIELINGKHPVKEADAFIFDVDFSAKDTAKKSCRFKLTIEPLGRRYAQDSTGGNPSSQSEILPVKGGYSSNISAIRFAYFLAAFSGLCEIDPMAVPRQTIFSDVTSIRSTTVVASK